MTAGLHVVTAQAVAPQPWRNGGGRTRELLAWPDAAAWTLRISVADIEHDGPFSAFPGIERWFAVIDGAGVLLQHPARQVTLKAADAPWRFDGEETPDCRLLAGATRDLNLMIRRDRGQGTLRRVEPGVDAVDGAAFRAIFTAEALTLRLDDHDALALAPFTLAWSASAGGRRWRAAPAAPVNHATPPQAWWLTVSPRS